jgi:hypothetical protein
MGRLDKSMTPPSPRTSYSLQDILQEKTNHIERLMKERETDREEMTSQSIIFQNNLTMVKLIIIL